jgi:hypothetical protein
MYRVDKEVCADLIKGFEKQKEQSNDVIISSNAKTFCLLIRQSLQESSLFRLLEEIAMLERQLKAREESSQSELQQLLERSQMQENHLKQIKAENDFFMRQVQDMEKNLLLLKDSSKRDVNKVNKESLNELVQKQKQLEEELQHEIITRDIFATKMKKIQDDINNLEDSLKPVLLKKLKVLEQELIQAKGEKDILIKQTEILNKQSSAEIDVQNKQLEKHNLKVAHLKQKNRVFERRLAKLTHRDYSISIEEHIEKIRKVSLYFTTIF